MFRVGIASGIVVLVALAVLTPFFHVEDHHSEGCAICTLAGQGVSSDLPALPTPGILPSVFTGLTRDRQDSPLELSHGRLGCRGPPSRL